ncbi:glycoside hydrolase family 16 protein [Karstenula rhodostoma CBS 690.94]|uniref:chitinase n=1 Tax=Karstenula rhodostoma CBS 690.94 TaxID=1392251 RepID=A0A9P4PXR9_9PLEO|nr:glycoside hydrolase family 16 protein [Karstenula rhodostoma CBS 690.94]
MYSFALSAAALLASSFLPTALAQTSTACNPLNTTGCPVMPALGANSTFDFSKDWNPDVWQQRNQGSVDHIDNTTAFTVQFQGDSPTVLSSFYIFFGRVEIVMRAAPGQGIVSSAILQSECLDEIDWEFLGTNTTHALTNYFGKGNTTDYTRGKDYKMKSAPQDDYHNYTIDWTKERVHWYIDDEMVRELKYEEALGGKNYPQTPMNVRLGAWSGGDVDNNNQYTVDWAGGPTDFSKAPFTMSVRTVYVQDYTTAKEYNWDDMDASGDWHKVGVVKLADKEKSDTIQEIEKPHGVKNRWGALSKTAKIAIIASIASVVAIIAAIMLFCCIKQRRAGRKEYATYQAGVDKEAADLIQHREQWQTSHAAARSSKYVRL